MASIIEQVNAMTMPKGIQRGNPFPLDVSSVWYSYDAMAAYAAQNPTAYVGQILSLVEGGKSTAYLINNEAGDLVKIGSGSGAAIFSDNKTIVITDSVLSLKDWKKQFYRWDKATQQYILTTVSDNNPWPAHLIPRVDDSGDALAWYEEQNDELENSIGSIAALVGNKDDSSSTDTIYGNIKRLEEQKLSLSGGTLTGPLILQDGSAAVSQKQLASAGTLKREIVAALPSVESADPNTIYMVLNSNTSSEDDKYNEYMLIGGSFELIGNTNVDLSNYITKLPESTAGNLAAIGTDGALTNSGIAAQDMSNHLVDKFIHITSLERSNWNAAKALAEKNETSIAAIPVISQHDADKLATLPPIAIISNGLSLNDSGALSLQIATKDNLGGVKSSDDISVDSSTGVMQIKQMSVHKIFIPDGDSFVLYGGTSND